MSKIERLAGVSFMSIVMMLMIGSILFKSTVAVLLMFALVFLYLLHLQRKQQTAQNSKVSTIIDDFIRNEDSDMEAKEQSRREDIFVLVFVIVLCVLVGLLVATSIDPHEIVNVNCVFSC